MLALHHKTRLMIQTLAAGGALLATTLAACAQDAGPETEKVVAESVSLMDLFNKGGILMYPLAAMSFIGLALVIYLFAVMRLEQIVPSLFRRDLMSKVNAGTWEDARMACAYRPCPLGEVTLAALDHIQASQTLDPAMLKDVMEGEGSRQATAVLGQPQYLLDVAVVSPMIGLLGTVFGMIRAFNVVALDLAKAKPMLLAAGVAEALITTAAGLIIGIPAMLFYAYFRGRASTLVSHLETASAQVMNALLRKRSA